MSDFTDFLIRLDGGEVVEFRHTAQTVREFLEIDDEIIMDIFGSQCVLRGEIRSVKLDPRPYVWKYHSTFGRIHQGEFDLWSWVNSLTKNERDSIKRRYYQARYSDFNE